MIFCGFYVIIWLRVKQASLPRQSGGEKKEILIMAKEKRFEKIYTQGVGSIEIWVDKETGVNYLYHSSGYSGGLTVLLDKDGKPVVTPVED